MICLALFFNFCKFGLLCFGGGYMLIPLLIDAYVGEGKLLTTEQFGNLVSIAQLTPGPVGINTATFAGFLAGGFPGALAATAGLVFPTLLLAGLAMSFIVKYREHPVMRSILYGARLGAAALVCYAVLIFMRLSLFRGAWKGFGEMPAFSPGGVLIFAFSFLLTLKSRLPVTGIILISGALGALLIPLIG